MKKQCDICSNHFRTGVRLKVWEWRMRKVFRTWIPLPGLRHIYICTKCEDTLRGLVRNYRKDRL